MGGPACAKVILCACNGAACLNSGYSVISYRKIEGEKPDFHIEVLSSIYTHLVEIAKIINIATGLTFTPRTEWPTSVSDDLLLFYQVIILKEDKFTSAQFSAIISHLDAIETLADQWDALVLKDAGYPPT